MWQRIERISGFTLIELLVVVSIIAVMVGFIAVNSLDSGKQSRDEKRQADIRNLQSALELYKNKYGRYPEACDSRVTPDWAGQQGTDYSCAGGNSQYIVGLAPEFISVLPVDPKIKDTNSGYVYMTNTNGTVYKLMAMNTVESELVSDKHPLRSCDIDHSSASSDIRVAGWCSAVQFNGNNTPAWCDANNERFNSSYAVWGGIHKLRTVGVDSNNPLEGLTVTQKISSVQDTTTIICR